MIKLHIWLQIANNFITNNFNLLHIQAIHYLIPILQMLEEKQINVTFY